MSHVIHEHLFLSFFLQYNFPTFYFEFSAHGMTGKKFNVQNTETIYPAVLFLSCLSFIIIVFFSAARLVFIYFYN